MTAETNTDTTEQHDDVPADVFEGGAEPSEASEAEAAEARETEAEAPPPVKEVDPAERVKQLEAEKVRIAADFANYQKRVNRDKARWSQEAVRDLVSSMLTVLDNLEHSIAAFAGDVKDPSVYKQGVELVQADLLRVLKTYDLEPIEAQDGTPFDPDLHQAISVQPSDDVEQEQVAFVARAGYRLGETIIRPAQVVVKKPS